MTRADHSTLARGRDDADRGSFRKLFLLSALILFLELAMIRWTVANVLYLGYFSNFVMLGSFLGVGLGCLRSEKSRDWFRLFPHLLFGFVAFVFLFHVDLRIETGDVVYFKSNTRTRGGALWPLSANTLGLPAQTVL